MENYESVMLNLTDVPMDFYEKCSKLDLKDVIDKIKSNLSDIEDRYSNMIYAFRKGYTSRDESDLEEAHLEMIRLLWLTSQTSELL